MDHPGIVLVMGDLDGHSVYDSLLVSMVKDTDRPRNLVRRATEQVRPGTEHKHMNVQLLSGVHFVYSMSDTCYTTKITG